MLFLSPAFTCPGSLLTDPTSTLLFIAVLYLTLSIILHFNNFSSGLSLDGVVNIPFRDSPILGYLFHRILFSQPFFQIMFQMIGHAQPRDF